MRQRTYDRLSSPLARMSGDQLRSLLGSSARQTDWGSNDTLTLDGDTVFLKRIPVTQLEYDNLLSTRNLYDLPTVYNYGFGSAGMGVYRELVTHVKVTEWILGGASESFPLLYHHRIEPFTGTRPTVDPSLHYGSAASWGGDVHVAQYLADRAVAPYELILFLEHFPHAAEDWLQAHPASGPMVFEDVWRTLTFLRDRGIRHFDSDLHNVLTDRERAYLGDFGLVLDETFDLSPTERTFARDHELYDYGNFLLDWAFQAYLSFRALPAAARLGIEATLSITDGARFEDVLPALLNNIGELHASRALPLETTYVDSVVKFREVILLMHAFASDMRKSDTKDIPFDHARLRQLLSETGSV